MGNGPRMTKIDEIREFEVDILDVAGKQLTVEARQKPGFKSNKAFESRVRVVVIALAEEKYPSMKNDTFANPQAFPDIAIGEFGVEVKYSKGKTWRTIANSAVETKRIKGVNYIYIMQLKAGVSPEVKWGKYPDSIVHVRETHNPRYEVDITTKRPIFDESVFSYEDFRKLPEDQQMQSVKDYTKNKTRGVRCIMMPPEEEYELPVHIRLYIALTW